MNVKKKEVVIIGGGASALMLAAELDSEKYMITVYEKNVALGRKFLVAGKGGFNLTHSESIESMVKRYVPQDFLDVSLKSFDNLAFRKWLDDLGIKTYVGTSKRVFPVKGIKPIEVLKVIEKKLHQNKVKIHFGHEWQGFGEKNELIFSCRNEIRKINADIIIFSLGGASWKVTGSDGSWLNYFSEKGITTHAFAPSNCAFKVDWMQDRIKMIVGKVLKNCIFQCGEKTHKGEAVLTSFGIEGSGVYPLSNEIRKQLAEQGTAQMMVDLKPDLNEEEIRARFERFAKLNVKEILIQKINLSEIQFELIKHSTTKEQYLDAAFLSAYIKQFPISISGMAPMDEAISTVGGIDLNEVKENFELKKLPDYYCIGEMLDWDAPTGGYLLQGCFSMGMYLAKQLNLKI